jgi:hypothetical protein
MKTKKRTVHNFVVKHSFNKSGAGAHIDKTGTKAPRNRQKKQWKKLVCQSIQNQE